jgi:hypothetical protein
MAFGNVHNFMITVKVIFKHCATNKTLGECAILGGDDELLSDEWFCW